MRGPVRALIPPPPPPRPSLSLSLSLSLIRSLFPSWLSFSLSLSFVHPKVCLFLTSSCLVAILLCPPILFKLVQAPPAVPALRFLLPSSSRLDSSTLGAYESTQPDTTRVQRGEFGDPLLSRRGDASLRGKTRFRKARSSTDMLHNSSFFSLFSLLVLPVREYDFSSCKRTMNFTKTSALSFGRSDDRNFCTRNSEISICRIIKD